MAEGDAHYDKKEWEKAKEAYERAIIPDMVPWKLVNNLGSVLFKLGRFEEAASRFEEALAAEPENPAVLHNLGDTYFKLENWEKVVSCFQPLLEKKKLAAGAYPMILQKLQIAKGQI